MTPSNVMKASEAPQLNRKRSAATLDNNRYTHREEVAQRHTGFVRDRRLSHVDARSRFRH
jgi:hypothetical protein